MHTDSANPSLQRSTVLIVAWAVTLLVSTLPTILLNELVGGAPDWLFWAKVAFVAVMLALTFLWKTTKPLAPYFIVILVLFLAEWGLQSWVGESSLWKSWFNSASFTSSMLGMQILRFGVALIMVAAMLVIKKHRSAFFLVRGDLSATAEPIPFLMNKPEP